MSEHRPDGPALHLVPGTDPEADGDAVTEARQDVEAPEADAPPVDGPPVDDATEDAPRDPLLARAERIADLPLAERPAAFDGLNRAVVAELNTLEEG